MARRWLRAGAAAAATGLVLGVPSVASAGTYTWTIPTAQTPGTANPDQDLYGARPWSYQEAQTQTTPGTPSTFGRLPSYSSAIAGGLSGWYDALDADQPFLATNRTGRVVGVVPDGALALQPARDRLVALTFASPLSSRTQVSLTGTFTAEDSDPTCLSRPTWTLEENATILASGGVAMGGSSQAIAASPVLAPGEVLRLVIGWRGASYSQACVTAGLTLSIRAPSNPPTVTLERPAAGTRIAGAQPTFSGQASSDFGDSPEVTVRVYKGSSATGAATEKLTAERSGLSYSVGAAPPLANGTYTAIAEQADLAGDTAASAPVTFTVHNIAPRIELRPLGPAPLRTAQPMLRGIAGTRPGDGRAIYVAVFKGPSAGGASPVRYLVGKRAADGTFAVRISPRLPDGTYTAVAAQAGAGDMYGYTKPMTFRIKLPSPRPIGPAVTLDRAGRAAIEITCTALTGACTGDVLVLTVERFAPVAGGPSGPVRVLFAHVVLPAGQTGTIRRGLPFYVARLLRRHAPLRVRVSATLVDSGGHAAGGTATRPLRRG